VVVEVNVVVEEVEEDEASESLVERVELEYVKVSSSN